MRSEMRQICKPAHCPRPATLGLSFGIILAVSLEVAQSATYGFWGVGRENLRFGCVPGLALQDTGYGHDRSQCPCQRPVSFRVDPIRMHFVSSCSSGPAQCHQALHILYRPQVQVVQAFLVRAML